MTTSSFCIFIDTVCEGRIPAWHDENLMPVVYPTLEAAQRDIADDVMEKKKTNEARLLRRIRKALK